jgi:serine/threonine protein kinase
MKLCFACNQQFGDDEVLCPKDGTRLVLLGVNPLIGFVIEDRYRLEEVIGNGAMGVVYRATQELIGRKVAVKILHSHLVTDSLALKRFQQEARAASRLNHAHIVAVFDYGLIAGDQPYIVMDLLKGMPLSRLIKDKGCLSVKEAMPIFEQVCEALEEAHKKKVIHRDIKPDNIVLTENGSNKNFVKVVDFGISKIAEITEEGAHNLTKAGTICGSPGYMAPERFASQPIDERADIYSLGVTLFEALTGQLPFSADNLTAMMTMHMTKPAPAISSIRPDLNFPPKLELLVNRALSKDANDRPQSARQFLADLQSVEKANASAAEALETVSRIINRPEETVSTSELSSMLQDHLQVRQNKIDKYEEWREGLAREQMEELKWKANPKPKPTWQAPPSVKFIAFLQTALPYVLTILLLFTVAWYVYREPRIALPKSIFTGQVNNVSAEEAMSQGNLRQAMRLYEEKLKAGQLSANEFEDLNRLYLRLAKEEARAHHYQAALSFCQKISAKSHQGQKARVLTRHLHELMDK